MTCYYRRFRSGWIVAVVISLFMMVRYMSQDVEHETNPLLGGNVNANFVRSLNHVINASTSKSSTHPAIPKLTPKEEIRQKLVKGNGSYNLVNPNGILMILNARVKAPLSWSQYGQDLLVNMLAKERTSGFFVEIGGYDGETNSNTLLLEKRGWDGLLIEVNPFLFKRMLIKDRKCHMIECCVSNEQTEMTFLLADALTVAESVLSGQHMERIINESDKFSSKENVHFGESIKARCFSLMDILDVLGKRRVDYFSLDVEGGELQVLKSIDFDKLDIKIFSVETDQNRDEILSFMEGKGYEWVRQMLGDDLFIQKSGHGRRFIVDAGV